MVKPKINENPGWIERARQMRQFDTMTVLGLTAGSVRVSLNTIKGKTFLLRRRMHPDDFGNLVELAKAKIAPRYIVYIACGKWPNYKAKRRVPLGVIPPQRIRKRKGHADARYDGNRDAPAVDSYDTYEDAY